MCVGAPPKEIRLAETQTVLKDEEAEQAIRTIICREVRPGPKKDRWHPLYTTSTAEPQEVLPIFRARQNHEQGHRVEVHDLLVDAVPCGYDKESPDRMRPRFHRGPLQMIGWLVALVYNAVADLAADVGAGPCRGPRADTATEVLQPTGAVVRNARGIDCVPGPVQGSGRVAAGHR